MKMRGIHNPWIKLLICYFLGVFGVHKFIERKTGIGLLYFFTFGILGIGWLVDTIKYFVVAIKSLVNRGTNEERVIIDISITTMESKLKKIPLWLLCIMFWLLTIIFMGAGSIISALLSGAFVLLVLPVHSWQKYVRRYIRGKFKVVAALLLVILCFVFI